MKKIESLSPEQEANMIAYRDSWLREVGYCTDPINPEAATKATKEFLDEFLPGDRKVLVVDGPDAAKKAAAKIVGKKAADKLEWHLFYEGQMSYWIPWYRWPHENLRPMHTDEQMRLLDLCEAVARTQFCFWVFDTHVFICNRPLRISVDDRSRLHHESLPAMEFRDGYKMWCWHRVEVPSHVITNPESITVDRALAEENVEIRRVMIERMGYEKLLDRSTEIHRDKYGILYRVSGIDEGEDVVFIRVENSTVEPDGTRKPYYLRVPPETKTALAAVAWTFDLSPEEYAPYIET